MADTVDVSRSSVRQAAEASTAALLERRFDDVELLVIYIDGMHFGEQCVLAAVGVDTHGRKHVLAWREGASGGGEETGHGEEGGDGEVAEKSLENEAVPAFRAPGRGRTDSFVGRRSRSGWNVDNLSGTGRFTVHSGN